MRKSPRWGSPAGGGGAAATGCSLRPEELLLAPGRGEALKPPQAVISVDLCEPRGGCLGKKELEVLVSCCRCGPFRQARFGLM